MYRYLMSQNCMFKESELKKLYKQEQLQNLHHNNKDKNHLINQEKLNPNNQDSKTPQQCNICGLIISNKWNYTLHMRVHNNDRRHKCNICNSSFITLAELKRHDLVVHSGIKERFQCRFCEKTYASRHYKYLHEDSHNKVIPYKCRHCPEVFSKFIERKTHEKEVHVKDNSFYNCSECRKKFTSRKFLENHEKNYHSKEENFFKCPECDKLFNKAISLQIHKRVHLKQSLNLNKNGYQDKNLQMITKKKPIESFGIRIYECIICTKRFNTKIDMLDHMSAEHPKENKAIFKYTCDICEKSFHYKQGLQNHRITHTGELKFDCKLCDYKTKRKTDLKVHMRKHTGEAPYVCDKCGKCFPHVSSFQYHKKKFHFGKVFKCDQCDLSFYRSKELDWHMKRHTEGGFKCSKCGKLLANPKSLKNHLRLGACVQYQKLQQKNPDMDLHGKEINFGRTNFNKLHECFACGFSSVSAAQVTRHENNECKCFVNMKIFSSKKWSVFMEEENFERDYRRILRNRVRRVNYKGILLPSDETNLEDEDNLVAYNPPKSYGHSSVPAPTPKPPTPPTKAGGHSSVPSVSCFSCTSAFETCNIHVNPTQNNNEQTKETPPEPPQPKIQEKVVSMNGKNFVSLDDLKNVDPFRLMEYLQSLI